MPLYSLLLVLVLVLGAPFWTFRLVRSGRYRAGLAQRLGRVPPELEPLALATTVVWLHAVSVGEVLAATGLIEEIERMRPEWTIAISTTTEAGQAVARQRFPEHAVFYLPLDFAVLVRRYVQRLRPRLLILMESEFWPNLLRECRRAGCEISVVNARISDRSFPRYLRLRRLWRPILGQISLFLAQGEESAGRLRAIGVPGNRIQVTGNLKYDLRAKPRGPVFGRIEAALPVGAALLVAGSTLEGEEALLLQAWDEIVAANPRSVLLLAPRHTNRFADVAELIRAEGFRAQRVSTIENGARVPEGTVLLLDTIGDLGGVYALAAAAFVGGSLVPAGGHNPLEPARFGIPVLMGPSFMNFREVVSLMQAKQAIRIVQAPADLPAAAVALMGGGAEAKEMGERGEEIFRSQAGAAQRSAEALLSLERATNGRRR